MNQTSPAAYRKTKAGQWVAFGPVSLVKVGPVAIAKRDGSTKVETVTSVGKTFTVDGVACCYGYLGETKAKQAPAHSVRHSAMCDECGEHRAVVDATDLSGIVGRVCRVCARTGHLSFC